MRWPFYYCAILCTAFAMIFNCSECIFVGSLSFKESNLSIFTLEFVRMKCMLRCSGMAPHIWSHRLAALVAGLEGRNGMQLYLYLYGITVLQGFSSARHRSCTSGASQDNHRISERQFWFLIYIKSTCVQNNTK